MTPTCMASAPRCGASSPHSYDCVILQQTDAATKSFHSCRSVMICACIQKSSLWLNMENKMHDGGNGRECIPAHFHHHAFCFPSFFPRATRSSSTFLRSACLLLRRISTKRRQAL